MAFLSNSLRSYKYLGSLAQRPTVLNVAILLGVFRGVVFGPPKEHIDSIRVGSLNCADLLGWALLHIA